MYKHPFPGPEPDLNSSIAGLQIMAQSASEASSGSNTPASSTIHRAKPSVPQKKNHIDELLRLRKELEEMKEARDQAYEERDNMADDLLKAQEDLEEKEKQLSKLSREVWNWREKAERLSDVSTGERPSMTQNRRSYGGGTANSPSSKEASKKTEMELGQARQQIQQLTSKLAESEALLSAQTSIVTSPEIAQQAPTADAQRQFQAQLEQVENHWRSQVAEQQKLRQTAEDQMRTLRDQYEVRLRDVESQAQSQVEEQQRRLQQVETELQGSVQQMEVDSGSTHELERLRHLVAEQETRVNEQIQCAEQFRRMSERLTTQVKRVNLEKRDLEQSEQAMRQHLEDLKVQAAASRRQQHNQKMPGGFQQY